MVTGRHIFPDAAACRKNATELHKRRFSLGANHSAMSGFSLGANHSTGSGFSLGVSHSTMSGFSLGANHSIMSGFSLGANCRGIAMALEPGGAGALEATHYLAYAFGHWFQHVDDAMHVVGHHSYRKYPDVYALILIIIGETSEGGVCVFTQTGVCYISVLFTFTCQRTEDGCTTFRCKGYMIDGTTLVVPDVLSVML